MGFASDYLGSFSLFEKIIKEPTDKDTGIIVVIPAYDEPDITETLSSLAECTEPDCKTEVLIIVNAPSDASAEGLANNVHGIEKIESWKKQNNNCFFRLYYFNTGQPEISHWGVGLARKTGMDEAVRRFDSINNPNGVVLSLDADCRVEKNYFIQLSEELYKKKERKACSVYFEHPVAGDRFPTSLYKAATLYELHLRYYFQALKYSGFPYVHHTVGSAIAIKASEYVKAGGMNRKQAGEDFYFVQKLVPAGGFFNLYGTTVYPSPRISLRVPFGTGHAIGKLIQMETPELYTYDFEAFNDLKKMFIRLEAIFSTTKANLGDEYNELPEGLRSFLVKEEWIMKLNEIKDNTSNADAFKKRFFNWFNMFRIVKYLNFIHGSYYCKKEIVSEARKFLELAGVTPVKDDPAGLLISFRNLERD